VIPLFSFVLSIWFAASAKKDAERAQNILDQLSQVMKGWQSEIMTAATNLLNSTPQIVEEKKTLTQSHALEVAIETLQVQLENRANLSAYEYNEIIKQLGRLGGALHENSQLNN
jgi:hypothetical protein